MSGEPTDRQADDSETAGVVARPPFLFLGAILLGLVLDRMVPLPFSLPQAGPARWLVAGLLAVGGFAVAATAIRNFSSAATPVQGYKPTRVLVTTGIHGWSRNPIYAGMFMLYLGIGIGASSPWILVLTLPLAVTIRYGVVGREEVYLERRFGSAYRDYKARVRRWF